MMRIIRNRGVTKLIPQSSAIVGSQSRALFFREYMQAVYGRPPLPSSVMTTNEDEDSYWMMSHLYPSIKRKLSLRSYRDFMVTYDKRLAFAMAMHKRLGAGSNASMLSEDIIKAVAMMGR